MGKADEAGFSLVPYNEKEAAVQGWQYGGDDGDRDTRLLPWIRLVISPSLRDPNRLFHPHTTFDFKATVDPAFMPMRLEARIVGVARACSANKSRKHHFLSVSSPPATLDGTDSCTTHFQVQLPTHCTCNCKPPPLPPLAKTPLRNCDPDGNPTDDDDDSTSLRSDDSSICGREQGDMSHRRTLRLPPTFDSEDGGYSVNYSLEIVGQLGKPAKGKGKGKVLFGLVGETFKVVKEYKFEIPLKVTTLPLPKPAETSAQLFQPFSKSFFSAATGAFQDEYIQPPAHTLGSLQPRRVSLQYDIVTQRPAQPLSLEPVYFGGRKFERVDIDGPRLRIAWWIDVNFGKHGVKDGEQLLKKLRSTPTSVSLEVKRVTTSRSTQTGLSVDKADESPILLSNASGYLDIRQGGNAVLEDPDDDGHARLWLYFKGETEVTPNWIGDHTSAPVLRTCIFDVRYDLWAKFDLGTLDDPIHVKCENVRLDLPGSFEDLVRIAKQSPIATEADQLPEGGGTLAPTPRLLTKLSKEEKGAVPATSDLPVPYQLRDSGLPDFSSAGPSPSSSSAPPLTSRLPDLDASGDAPPAYERVMAAPGVVDEPSCASTSSAPAYAGCSATSLTCQRALNAHPHFLINRRLDMGEKSEVNGGSGSRTSDGVYQAPGDTGWRDLPLTAAFSHQDVYDADWVSMSVRPPVSGGRGHPPATVFELEATIPHSLQPMDVKASLQGVSEVHSPPFAEQHSLFETTDSNAIVLGNTFLTDSSDTATDASRPSHFTLRLPDRTECSCPISHRVDMPSSWKSENCEVRYWLKVTAQKLVDTRRWKGKGKGKAPMNPSGQIFRLKLPLVVTAAPLPPQAPTPDLSPRIRDEKTPETEWETTSSGRHTKLRFREDGEQAQSIRSLEFTHRITTDDPTPDNSRPAALPLNPSLHYTLAVSLGVHTYPGVQHFLQDLRQHASDETSKKRALASISVERKTWIKRRTDHTHFDQPPLISTEPCQVSPCDENLSTEERNVKYKVEQDMRLVGPPGERGVRAEEVFLVFEGDLSLERDASWQDVNALAPRVKSCNLEVWHDLIVSFQLSPDLPPCAMRVPDVRFDLPASHANPDACRKTSDFTSSGVQVDPGRFPALAALYGGTRASSSTGAGPSQSSRPHDDGQLPPYVPLVGPAPAPVDAKAPVASSAASETSLPPSYDTVASVSAAAASTYATRRPSVIHGMFGRRTFVSNSSATSSSSSSRHHHVPAYGAAPPLSSTDAVLARDAPPSWEETVREDLAEDWLPAATAYADGGLDRSRAAR